MEEINTTEGNLQEAKVSIEEEEFNSLDWLKNNVEEELSEEKTIRRKRRNQRKRRKQQLKKVKIINTNAPKVRTRKLLPDRNEPCPCGATNNDKPIKYKNCCGKV